MIKTMSKYNVYVNSECVWEGDDYDVALREYKDCINDEPYAMIDLYEIDRYGNMIYLEGINWEFHPIAKEGKVMYAKDIDDPFVVKTENNPYVVM